MAAVIKKSFTFMPGDPDAKAHRDRGNFKLKGPSAANRPRLTPEALAGLYAKQGLKPGLTSAARQAGRPAISFKKTALQWTSAEVKTALDWLGGTNLSKSSRALIETAAIKSLVGWLVDLEPTGQEQQFQFPINDATVRMSKHEGLLSGFFIDPEAGIDADFEQVTPERLIAELLKCYGIGDCLEQVDRLSKQVQEEAQVDTFQDELQRLVGLLDRNDLTRLQKTEIRNTLKSVLDGLERLSKDTKQSKPAELDKLYEIPMSEESCSAGTKVKAKSGERLRKSCGDCHKSDCICYDLLSRPSMIKTQGDLVEIIFGTDWTAEDQRGYMRSKGLYPVRS